MSATLASPPVALPAGTPPVPSGIPTSTISDPPTFRSHFPPFADDTVYPDPQVQFFIDVASVMVLPYFWGKMTQLGVELLTAHFLTLQQFIMRGAEGGGVPGMATGIASSKSVSRVSISYDQSLGSMKDWGPFNYTLYGRQYAFYAQMVGTGGYETLAVGVENTLAGTVWTWARGVMWAWGS